MAVAFLPTTLEEARLLGWDALDVVIVTGDAYVDHPSFGAAVIGRLWESLGLRVGILPQPDWSSATAFQALGRPRLFFGVTAGNMDSMVNRYTSDRRLRHNDAYTPNDEGGKRPDRAAIVYAQRCREAYRDAPIVLGGIEASLRRVAQFDYWSETVRRSILFDAKADILVYGNGETAAREIARRALAGDALKEIRDLRGTAVIVNQIPPDWVEEDARDPDAPPRRSRDPHTVVRLPSFEQVRDDPTLYALASRVVHLETNPGDARPMIQAHGDRLLWVNPPPIPLDTPTLDAVFELPYARAPHPRYGDARIPAWEMIRFSVQILRGCFGGCSFCSITEHEGRQIQSRSPESVLREIGEIRDKTKGFTGVISDVGGPTANMWRLGCRDPAIQNACRRPSCLHPDVCKNLNTDHGPLIDLYRRARAVPGIKKIFVASGVRYDLANLAPDYVRELARHHVGGYLKVAPEHVAPGPLAKMLKPGIAAFERFQALFQQAAQEAGKELYLIPYFIAAHPGTSDEDMLTLALWLKNRGLKVDQVQTYLPSPMALATAMHHSGRNPLRPIRRAAAETDLVRTATGLRQRRLHKAFIRWHDPENWPILREALKRMGRSDLIGAGPSKLIPADVAPRQGKSRPTASRPPRR